MYGGLHEVWLIDTGHFIDMTTMHPAWAHESRWYTRLIRRRVLRMFVPQQELTNLPALERDFMVVKRFFEMRDAVRKGRPLQDQYEALMGRLVEEKHSPIKQVPTEYRSK